MKKKLLLIIFLLFISGLRAGEFRENIQLELFSSEKTSLVSAHELRFISERQSPFTYVHTDVGFRQSLSKSIQGLLRMRLVFQKDGVDWHEEIRPYCDLNLKLKSKVIGFQDRFRIEGRLYLMKAAAVRFRNRIMFLSSGSFGSLKIQPFTSYEIFCQPGQPFSVKHEIFPGFQGKFPDSHYGFSASAGVEIHKGDTGLESIFVMGLTLKISSE